jgi:hypothetical protein
MARNESQNTGSILDLNFDDVYEPELFDDGDEVDMTIKAVKVGPSKSQKNTVIAVTMWDPSDYKKSPLVERLTVPSKADHDEDPVKYNNMMRRLRDFGECFSVEMSGVNPADDWPGSTGSVIVRLEEDETYGKRNSVKKFVIGH